MCSDFKLLNLSRITSYFVVGLRTVEKLMNMNNNNNGWADAHKLNEVIQMNVVRIKCLNIAILYVAKANN